MKKKILIFGLGYVGSFLAKELAAQGWNISGTCRTSEKKQELEKLGYKVELFDGEKKITNWENFTRDTTHVLHCIAPVNTIDPVLLHKDDLDMLQPAWFGYLSTTGVYGDHQGKWVDENSELRATSQRSLARLDAENAWCDSITPAHIFRLSGIYGPGRNAIENPSQQNIYAPDHHFSRIHVGDIVSTLLASINKPQSGQIYNLADDLPSPSYEVIEYAAQILRKNPPVRVPLSEADLSPMGREFYANNKRVKNDKIKSELGVVLTYPTYRDGLKNIAKNLDIS